MLEELQKRYTVRVAGEMYDEGSRQWIRVTNDEDVEVDDAYQARRKALDNTPLHKLPFMRNVASHTMWTSKNRVVGDPDTCVYYPFNPVLPLHIVRPQKWRKWGGPKPAKLCLQTFNRHLNAYFTYVREGGDMPFVMWRKAYQLKQESLRPVAEAGETDMEQLLRSSANTATPPAQLLRSVE